MFKRNAFAKSALACGAAAMTFGAVISTPLAAQAQSSGDYGQSYEACKRASTNRTIVGSLVGAAAGAALGFNMGARGHRNDGGWTGAAVGGLGGGLIGNRTAQPCDTGQPYPQTSAGYSNGYGAGYYQGRNSDGRGYYNRGAYNEPARYGRTYSEDVVVEEAPVADSRADNCQLAESPIYLPDGRVQKRFVRVCQDASGRYQVVD